MRLRLSSLIMTWQLATIHFTVAAHALACRARSEVFRAVAINALQAQWQMDKRHGANCVESERLHQLAREHAKRACLDSTMVISRQPHRAPCALRGGLRLCRGNAMDRAKQGPTPHLGQRPPATIVKLASPEPMTMT